MFCSTRCGESFVYHANFDFQPDCVVCGNTLLRQESCESMKASVKSITSSESSGSWVRYCVVVNSLQHALSVLQEWNESMLFLKLNFAVHVRFQHFSDEGDPSCRTYDDC
jgi:hypothetical protein